MELHSLNCPRCGAVIDLEDGLDTFFCKYCGNKIVLSGQSDAAYDAKVRMQENQLKYENEKAKLQLEKEKQKIDSFSRFIHENRALVMMALLLAAMIICAIMGSIFK